MYVLESIEQEKPRSSLARAPLHIGIRFYFRYGEDFYKMCFHQIFKKHAWLCCCRYFSGVQCRFRFKIGHSFETVRFSSKHGKRRFADTVTKDQLLSVANYQFEDAKVEDQNHRQLCKISKTDICQAHEKKAQIKQAKTPSSQKLKISGRYGTRSKIRSSQSRSTSETFSSGEIGPIPTELQFLLDQPEVAVDITDSCTEFEFTAEEILSGGEQATMIILPNPAFETE